MKYIIFYILPHSDDEHYAEFSEAEAADAVYRFLIAGNALTNAMVI